MKSGQTPQHPAAHANWLPHRKHSNMQNLIRLIEGPQVKKMWPIRSSRNSRGIENDLYATAFTQIMTMGVGAENG